MTEIVQLMTKNEMLAAVAQFLQACFILAHALDLPETNCP